MPVNKRLDKIIEFFVENTSTEKNPENKELLKKAIREQLLKEIKSELTAEEIERLQKSARKAQKAQERKRLKTYILEAILVAFVVGLTVNQVTGMGDIILSALGWNEAVWTVVAIIVLLIFLTWFVAAQIMAQLGDDDE